MYTWLGLQLQGPMIKVMETTPFPQTILN